MRAICICTIAALCALFACTSALGATQVIKGTVVESPGGAASVHVNTADGVVAVKRTNNTVITRGPVGKSSHAVPLREFSAGDQFVAIIQDGQTVSMKATYDPSKPAAKPSVPLKINSITFSAPVPLKAGDVITVDLSGTPGTNAAFSVKGLIPVVKMTEQSPGSYRGTVKTPSGKIVRNAPLVGYLGSGDKHASPVQASRLVTLAPDDEPLKPSVPPMGFAKPAPVPAANPQKMPPVQPVRPTEVTAAKPVSQPETTTVAAPADGKIVLVSPIDGATMRRAITVKGTADPDSTVKVTITYSNTLTGLLKLAGEVASQNVSVGKDGEFRMGPIALDGPMATDGLRFTIKAYYPDRADHGTAMVNVVGHRD